MIVLRIVVTDLRFLVKVERLLDVIYTEAFPPSFAFFKHLFSGSNIKLSRPQKSKLLVSTVQAALRQYQRSIIDTINITSFAQLCA